MYVRFLFVSDLQAFLFLACTFFIKMNKIYQNT